MRTQAHILRARCFWPTAASGCVRASRARRPSLAWARPVPGLEPAWVGGPLSAGPFKDLHCLCPSLPPAKARTLDHERQQAGGRHALPSQACVSRCRVTSSARCWRRCGPETRCWALWWVSSYQGCSEALHGLAREAAKAKATGRWGCGACTRRWGSTRTACIAAGVASVFCLSGGRSCVGGWVGGLGGRASVSHSSAAACPSLGGRTPTSFTTARPPPAYAHGREAVGGAEAWPQVHPGVVRGAGRHARRQAGRQACL
jgi:hypothetical protein